MAKPLDYRRYHIICIGIVVNQVFWVTDQERMSKRVLIDGRERVLIGDKYKLTVVPNNDEPPANANFMRSSLAVFSARCTLRLPFSRVQSSLVRSSTGVLRSVLWRLVKWERSSRGALGRGLVCYYGIPVWKNVLVRGLIVCSEGASF